VLADQAHRAHEGVRVETGGQRDHIDLMQAAVGGDDAFRRDMVDAGGDQVDVAALDGAVEPAGDDQPSTHRLVIGRQCRRSRGSRTVRRLARHAALISRRRKPGLTRAPATNSSAPRYP